jgi:hypothetical protein
MITLPNKMSEDYLAEVKAQAKERGILEKLEKQLAYLGSYGCSEDPEYSQCVLMRDFSEMSFHFTMLKKAKDIKGTWEYWFSGAMIFYAGAGKPGVPEQFSVSLDTTNEDRWEVHT